MDGLKGRRGYSHLKEEALDRNMWRNRFGGGFEPVVRQNTERMMNYNLVGPPSYMRSIVDRNVVMRRMTVHAITPHNTKVLTPSHS